jgi:hypothetical protein
MSELDFLKVIWDTVAQQLEKLVERLGNYPIIKGEKYIAMSFIQARSADWVKKPFFSEYDEKACWIDELEPAFGEKSFFFDRDESKFLEFDDFNDETGLLSSAMTLC